MNDKKIIIEIDLKDEGNIAINLEGGKIDNYSKFILLMSLQDIEDKFKNEVVEVKKFLEDKIDE